MKASIKLLTSQRKTKRGFPICVELFFSNRQRPRKIIGYSEIYFWNDEAQKPFKEHPDYYSLLPVVLEYKSKVLKVNFGNYSFNEAKEIIFSEPGEKAFKETYIIEFFQTIIEEKITKKISHKAYLDVKQQLENYLTSDIPINQITYEWLNDFVLYKKKTGCNDGGIMSYLRTMRAVYKEAQRRTSLNIKKDNPFLGIIKTPTPKPVINLPINEFQKLSTFQPKKSTSNKTKQRINQIIDVFMFQFLIGGHDYVDIALLTWKNIYNGRVKFQRYKLRNKKLGGPVIDNLICDKASEIIKQHGTHGSDRVFSFIPSPIESPEAYTYYRKNVNRTLSTISKGLKYDNAIKTKSPRYIFRTLAGELLIHDLIVMKLQGHTPQGVTFSYQGHISYKTIDEAHLKIINSLDC